MGSVLWHVRTGTKLHCPVDEADAAGLREAAPPVCDEAAWAVVTVDIAAIITRATITTRPLDLTKIFFIDPPTDIAKACETIQSCHERVSLTRPPDPAINRRLPIFAIFLGENAWEKVSPLHDPLRPDLR